MKRKHVIMVMDKYDHQTHMGVVKYAHEANWVLQTKNLNNKFEVKYFGEGILSLHDDDDRIRKETKGT